MQATLNTARPRPRDSISTLRPGVLQGFHTTMEKTGRNSYKAEEVELIYFIAMDSLPVRSFMTQKVLSSTITSSSLLSHRTNLSSAALQL